MNNEFYVGYLPIPPRLGRFVLVLLPAVVLVVVVISAVLAAQQNHPGDGGWDLGGAVSLTGRVTAEPYSILTVPGEDGEPDRQVLLVTMGKVGGGEFSRPVAGEWVTVTGYLIERDGRTMLTVEHGPADIAVKADGPALQQPRRVSLGHRKLRGEIIDPKCYFGAMKPGVGKVHKACATLCISGGIPPMFVTRDETGQRTYFLLTDTNGNGLEGDALDALLPFVADPVQIAGEIDRWGDLLVCRLDPGGIERQ